jgi:hypothetical protein
MQTTDNDKEFDSPTKQKCSQGVGIVSVPKGCQPIMITVAYISPELAKKQNGQSLAYMWPQEDYSLIVPNKYNRFVDLLE